MPRLLAALLALTLLSACQLSLPGRDRAPDTTANPVTGGAITTTTLDAPAAPTTAPAAPPATTATATAASPTDPRPQPRPETTAETTADPTAETAAEATAEAPAEATAETAPEIPAALKSPSQIACEDDGGNWARAGDGGGMACVYQTRDGGKRCDGKDDCEGECLARSRSCSPIQPLFGCNAVLLDTGAEVTLCLD